MDQTVRLNVVGTVWVTLPVTEQPESVTLVAILGTLEICLSRFDKMSIELLLYLKRLIFRLKD